MKRICTVIVLSLALIITTANAAEPTTPATNSADLTQLEWLVGHWVGDGFGGRSEEIWSPAKDGVMMGMFRHHNADGSINFYEFMTISHDGLRLKHFHPDMRGWEEKDDYLHFSFRSQTPSRIEFGGLSFQEESEQRMTIRLRMKTAKGERVEAFNMQRVRPQ